MLAPGCLGAGGKPEAPFIPDALVGHIDQALPFNQRQAVDHFDQLSETYGMGGHSRV
jgi:hypothetical protein